MTKTQSLMCAERAACYIAPTFRRSRWGATQEAFAVVPLDARNRPLRKKPIVVAMGTLTSVEVHPRDVFREAVRLNAAAVIVAHNHPSGDPEPSAEDRDLTERLRQAGRLLGIPLLDHFIITREAYVSLADRGLL